MAAKLTLAVYQHDELQRTNKTVLRGEFSVTRDGFRSADALAVSIATFETPTSVKLVSGAEVRELREYVGDEPVCASHRARVVAAQERQRQERRAAFQREGY